MWHNRLQELDRRERENPHLSEYLDDRYRLERALARAVAYRRATSRYPSVRDSDDLAYYDLYSFAATVGRAYPGLSPGGKGRLRGYLRDGIQTDNGLAPVATEMTVAAHLSAAGFDAEFSDTEGLTPFDFLATKQTAELEVECKTISGDIGRPIHRNRALMFFHRIDRAIGMVHARGDGAVVEVTIPDSLHGRNAHLDSIGEVVSAAAREDRDQCVDGVATVKLHRFQLDRSPFDSLARVTQELLGRFLGDILGYGNTEGVARCSPGRAITIASIRSDKPGKVVDSIYRSLKQSAENQFSRGRPALLVAHLTDIKESQLLELARERLNGLAAIATRLFVGPARQHLHGIAFLAPSQTLASAPLDAGYQVSLHAGGSVLIFNNHQHPLATDDRLRVFRTAAG